MSFFAWPESPFRFTQDFRPGLSSVAPTGLVLVYAISSIDGSLRVERLETMVLDLLLRTCASNGFGLALLGARTRRPALHVPRDCVRSFALLTGADARPPLGDRLNFS
jgi:hypothetical protein